MDLKGIVSSEVSQRKTNTAWYHLYVESIRKINVKLIEQRRKVVASG